MIQRVQTVFLLLAIVSLGLFLCLPLLRVEAGRYTDETPGWDVNYYYGGYIFFINAIFTGTAIGFTLINIFLFKYRKLQMLLCWGAVLFIAAAAGYVYYRYNTVIFMGDVIFRKWNLFAAIATVFELLAWFFIRKDEQLVKSLDRLR